MKRKIKNMKHQPLTAGMIISIILFVFLSVYAFDKKEYIIGIVSAVAAIFSIVYFAVIKKRHAKDLVDYINLITTENSTLANDAISRFPLATVFLRIDGRIMWYNDMFSGIFEGADLYDVLISSIMPELKWSEILKSADGIKMGTRYKNRIYDVRGNIVSNAANLDEKGQPVYSVLLYFIDRTETEKLLTKYNNERTDVAIINIDNFEDIFQKMDDDLYQNTVSAISRIIGLWVSQSKGILKKTERDRYIVFFEHKYMEAYIKAKFDILEKIRAIGDEIKIPVTLSIGMGTGGLLNENEAYARSALDMALGRGGDQVAIKDDTQFTFYGGNTKDYEKSTRVKTRSFSVAFKDFIKGADKVIFMGHSNSDYDCFGAAIGLQRAVRSLGKKPYIVFDNSPGIKQIADEIKNQSEYEGMLVSPLTALEIITQDTLLVILDTHRPSMLPASELLARTGKIVLIDHHRRSTEFIASSSITYHEPYASSTCEMATEIMQYIDDKRSLTSFEAMALYVGILMDTKNFITKTGVRTFEAASYLKRYGLDTAAAKRILNPDKDEYMKKLDIVKTTEIYNSNMAIAKSDIYFPNIRAVSSQAADDMLNISGTVAAFVMYPLDGNICISARSLGECNVQIIMEKLGGGGHMTVAGAQIKDIDMQEAELLLQRAIDEYLIEK